MTTYVCPVCQSVHEFMSLAVLCSESHTIGVASELTADGREAAPVLLRKDVA